MINPPQGVASISLVLPPRTTSDCGHQKKVERSRLTIQGVVETSIRSRSKKESSYVSIIIDRACKDNFNRNL